MGRALKNTFLIALFLLTGAASAGPRAPLPIDIVFDLDWTLLSTIDEHSVVRDESKIFTLGGTRYRISDGVVESLNLLRRFPHVRISYFSGGVSGRNEAALRKIILDPKTGLTAWDVMVKRLNFENLEDLQPENPTMKFRDRYRKNLAPYFENLDRVVLIDDVKEFAAAGQIRNMVWIGKTFNFYETAADALRLRTSEDPTHLPENALEWEIERNRIPTTTLILEKAILEDLRSTAGSLSFLERVARAARASKETLLQEWKGRFPQLFPCRRLLENAVTSGYLQE